MKTVTVDKKDLKVQDLFALAESEPLILTRQDGNALAVFPLDEADVEAWKLSESPTFMEIIERSRDRYRDEGGVSLEEVRRRFDHVTEG